MSRHVMEALGKTRIVIEDGKVIEIGEPLVKYCPLFNKYRGIKEFNADTIRENIEYRIDKFGMCTGSRETRMKDFLSFGVSETISFAVSNGILDAAVIAADGCGTCILTDPELIQGMGGRISGIYETSPIDKVIEDIGKDRVLDPYTAIIDQRSGVKKAFEMGYSKVAVTIARSSDAAAIRKAFGDKVVIFAVHTTGSNEQDAKIFFETCDVITGCASATVRTLAGTKALLKAGSKVPVFAASETGKELILMKLKELGKEASYEDDETPLPLI